MSFIDVKSLIDDGRKSLENKQYWSALSVALMVPSICSRVEYRGEPIKDQYMYERWCNEYLCAEETNTENSKGGWFVHILGPDYAKTLYGLRCDLLHSAELMISYNDVKRRNKDGREIYFSVNAGVNYTLTKCIIISIEDLCNEMFDYAVSWFNTAYTQNKNFHRTTVFDCNNEDDRLLCKALCDEDKKEFLLSKFNNQKPFGGRL